MNTVCGKSEISFGIQTVSRATATRIAIPALGGILLTADKDTQTSSFRATDLELTINCTVKATVNEAGSVVLPGRFMTEMVRNLDDDNVSLVTDGTNVTLESGSSKYHLRTLPVEEFPLFETLEGNKVSISLDSLIKGVKKVARAAAKDESRPTISGVLVQIHGNKIELAATDSYRLALFSSEGPGEDSDDEFKFLLPVRSLDELVRVFSSVDVGGFQVVAGDGEVAFISDEIEIRTRTIEGSFPQYQQLFPQEFEVKASIKREQLLKAVQRAAIVASSSPLKLKWTEGSVEITAGAQEVGEAQESLEASFDKDPFEIAFNPLFLKDGLQLIEGDTVEFNFVSSVKPGLLTSSDDEGYSYLIMPVRT